MLNGLRYLWPEQDGTNWASPEEPLGQVLYDTYTEEDYHIIWDTYSYQDFSWDFGKLNSSVGKPRHSRLSPIMTKVYKQQVCPPLILCSVLAYPIPLAPPPPLPHSLLLQVQYNLYTLLDSLNGYAQVALQHTGTTRHAHNVQLTLQGHITAYLPVLLAASEHCHADRIIQLTQVCKKSEGFNALLKASTTLFRVVQNGEGFKALPKSSMPTFMFSCRTVRVSKPC